MDPSQQESRQTAAEAFMESLDQLEHSLQEADALPSAGDRSAQSAPKSHSEHSDRIDVRALEEAAADIEQYMQHDQSNPG